MSEPVNDVLPDDPWCSNELVVTGPCEDLWRFRARVAGPAIPVDTDDPLIADVASDQDRLDAAHIDAAYAAARRLLRLPAVTVLTFRDPDLPEVTPDAYRALLARDGDPALLGEADLAGMGLTVESFLAEGEACASIGARNALELAHSLDLVQPDGSVWQPITLASVIAPPGGVHDPEWCVRMWGTPEELLLETRLPTVDGRGLQYTFMTRGTPVYPWVIRVATEFPSLIFRYGAAGGRDAVAEVARVFIGDFGVQRRRPDAGTSTRREAAHRLFATEGLDDLARLHA